MKASIILLMSCSKISLKIHNREQEPTVELFCSEKWTAQLRIGKLSAIGEI